MKKSLLLVLFCFCLMNITQAQNTFPSSGNVGVGTMSPKSLLEINSNLSSGNLFQIYDAGILRSTISYVGTQAWYLNNSISEAGLVEITTPGGYPGIIFSTDSSGNYINRFNILNKGNYFGMGYDNVGTTLNISQSGDVGIGTTSPSGKLTVDYSNGDPKSLSIFSSATDLVNSPIGGLRFSWYGANYADIQMVRGSDAIDGLGLAFLTSTSNSGTTTEAMRITPNGSVGIGTTSPQSKFAVNGTITATQVKVTQTGWSDFVFDSGYHLAPLSKTAAFIKRNHHLPDIPSAKEIESNGLDLGSMEKKQMQKIEELTLYLIKTEKEMKEIKSENKKLKKALENLKTKVEGIKSQQ